MNQPAPISPDAFKALDTRDRIRWVARLLEEGVSAQVMKEQFGLSRFDLSHYRRLHRCLTADALTVIHQARLSLKHARAIASLKPAAQEPFAREISRYRWSGSRAEAQARSIRQNAAPAPDASYYAAIAETIAEQIGHPVTIKPDPGGRHGGDIVIRYADFDCFDSVLERMRVRLPE